MYFNTLPTKKYIDKKYEGPQLHTGETTCRHTKDTEQKAAKKRLATKTRKKLKSANKSYGGTFLIFPPKLFGWKHSEHAQDITGDRRGESYSRFQSKLYTLCIVHTNTKYALVQILKYSTNKNRKIYK